MTVRRCPCFNLGLAHRKVARVFEMALSPLNLTIAQAHCLSALYDQDERLAKDLARELGVDAGTLTPMLDRLERMGYIRRCPHPADRRATRICLEPAGQALKPQIAERCGEATDRLARRFTPEEYALFLSLTQKLVDEASEEGAPEASPLAAPAAKA